MGGDEGCLNRSSPRLSASGKVASFLARLLPVETVLSTTAKWTVCHSQRRTAFSWLAGYTMSSPYACVSLPVPLSPDAKHLSMGRACHLRKRGWGKRGMGREGGRERGGKGERLHRRRRWALSSLHSFLIGSDISEIDSA